MAKRKSISKKIRFEVFKRDSFICQYCGQSAPEVVLQVDHIQPISKGGDDDITNLITACQACNSGKGARKLDDDTVIQKRKAQLDELQERREQLAMMVEWHKELINLEDETVETVADYWSDIVGHFSLNDLGKDLLKKYLKRYDVPEILKAIKVAADQYLEYDEEGLPTKESAMKAFDYVPKICGVQRRMEKKPYLKNLYYIRGIVRNRMYCNEWRAMQLLEAVYLSGVDIDELKEIAIESKNWTEWRTAMESYIDGDV